MITVLLMWGPHAFVAGGAAYEELEHKWGGRWKDHEVIGRRPVGQYTGPGKETIRIRGATFPLHQRGGGQAMLRALQQAAGNGDVHPLVSGTGNMFGTFRLDEMTRSESEIVAGGQPLKIKYDLNFVYQEDMGGSIWSLWP